MSLEHSTEITITDICIFISKVAHNVQKGLAIIQKNENNIKNMIQLVQIMRQFQHMSNMNEQNITTDENHPILFIE